MLWTWEYWTNPAAHLRTFCLDAVLVLHMWAPLGNPGDRLLNFWHGGDAVVSHWGGARAGRGGSQGPQPSLSQEQCLRSASGAADLSCLVPLEPVLLLRVVAAWAPQMRFPHHIDAPMLSKCNGRKTTAVLGSLCFTALLSTMCLLMPFLCCGTFMWAECVCFCPPDILFVCVLP
jgi:hypothetical protein